MANNENINKVIYGNDTLIDLTSDTVTQADVLNSKSFHDASGTLRTGTADISGKADLTDLADAFSESTAYSIGDYVTYDGDFYRFRLNKTAGAWDNTKVVQITVGGEFVTKASLTDLANEFSTGTVYGIGKYITYNGHLYRFTAVHLYGDEWDESKVVRVAVLNDLQQARKDITEKQNLTSFNSTDFFVMQVLQEDHLPQENVSLKRAQSIDVFDGGVASGAQVATAVAKKADPAIIAPKFSTTTAYSKGDYVTNDFGVVGGSAELYRFTADHPAGSWTFDTAETVVGDELKSLNNNVSDLQNNVKANTQLISESIWGESGKNLFDYGAFKGRAVTNSGITFDINMDGTVKCTNTATANPTTMQVNCTLPAGDYILNGCPANGSDSSYRLDIPSLGKNDYGNGVEFTLDAETQIAVRIRFANGYACPNDGIIFAPMIRKADILDPTYEPYRDSIKTNVNSNTALISESIWGESGKNLLRNDAVSQDDVNGITWTIYADGTVMANGTASANSACIIFNKNNADGVVQNLLNKNLILTGCPANGSSSKYTLFCNKWDGTNLYDYGNGVNVSVGSSVSGFRVDAVVYSGQTVSNLIFRPMLRDASILDPTYEPYHSSVKDTLRDAEVIEGKNLLPFHTQTIIDSQNRSFPFVADRNGFMTCSEINDYRAWQYANSNEFLKLAKGRYKIKIVQKTAKTSGYIGFDIFDDAGNVIYACTNETLFAELIANGATFTLSADTNIGVEYKVGNGSYAFMIYKDSEKDDTFEPFYIPLKDSMFPREEQRVLGAKNLLPYPYRNTTKTTNGITFTDNQDGTITANGTATADAYYTLQIGFDGNKFNGNILSGCPSGGSSSTYHLYLCMSVDPFTHYADDYGSGANINCPTSVVCQVIIRIKSGQTVDNLVFKPMLRLATDPDDTYVPYAMTNKELTDKAYNTSDTAETTIADADYFPFYDTSATGKRKTLWSTIKSVLKTYFDSLYNKYLENNSVVLSTSTTTDVTFTDASITANSVIDFACTVYDLVPDNMTATTGSCTVTLPKVDSAMTVGVRLYIRS